MNSKKTYHMVINKDSDDGITLISNALSGTTGGALLGSSFGIIGGIIGGLVGGFFTGYSGYRTLYKCKLKVQQNRK